MLLARHRSLAPQPSLYKQRGGGPIHDIEHPLRSQQIVNLLGPVARVSASATIGNPQRTISSQPLAGQKIDVEVPTMVNGTLEFAQGANVTDERLVGRVGASACTRSKSTAPKAACSAPIPTSSAARRGAVGASAARRGRTWGHTTAHPFGVNNQTTGAGLAWVANYRVVGVLDMAMAIREGRPHRASGELALHVLEVLDAFERSSVEGRHITITTPVTRPAASAAGHRRVRVRRMKTIKGPGIYFARFLAIGAPFDSLGHMARWAASLGYKGMQVAGRADGCSTSRRRRKARPIAMRCAVRWRRMAWSPSWPRICKANWWPCIRPTTVCSTASPPPHVRGNQQARRVGSASS